MIAEMKIVPFQRLAVRVKAFHHPLLHRKRAVLIVAAIKDHGGARDFHAVTPMQFWEHLTKALTPIIVQIPALICEPEVLSGSDP